ncbi:redoxin domain-containing protein [Flavitalea sp. BT771]|uniref:redoxin domain-containing protein n=1 Tax=Flavitalea sp. BT771 TaxID=3063329 RepID=UPI0026E1DB16|nr:redoxin domain-containing protein [Flavitalea sp. BT771]MDO6433058.1 redoxin domain-containing protein [Flavitalea sp. BT771]MDV6221666.1 redoxin domain-containing protein [Flavitalea sp. BT771]
MKLISLLLIGVLPFIHTFSQDKEDSEYPQIGKLMPDFELTNIVNFEKKEMRRDDFKGKWLILDFWNRTCGACVASFPRMNKLQQVLGDHVQVMLVGIQDRENQIQKIYSKFKVHEDLILPCAFDSLVPRRFDILIAPHIILLDDKGIVRCVTSSVRIEDMKDFLAGNSPEMPKPPANMGEEEKETRIPYDSEKPFLIAGNGGRDSDFLFRSVFSVFNVKEQHFTLEGDIDNHKDKGCFQVLGVDIPTLFNYAYFGACCGWDSKDTSHYGKVYQHLILQIKDTSRFKPIFKNGQYTDLYSYSLIMPSASCTKEKLQQAMQRDLATYFGYETILENRPCPYLKLVAAPGTLEKLRTKGGARSWESIRHAGFIARNISFKDFLSWLDSNISDKWYWEDETGLKGNIDIDLDCIPSNLGDLRKALQRNGLDLVGAKKDMQALVIRDGGKSPTQKDLVEAR